MLPIVVFNLMHKDWMTHQRILLSKTLKKTNPSLQTPSLSSIPSIRSITFISIDGKNLKIQMTPSLDKQLTNPFLCGKNCTNIVVIFSSRHFNYDLPNRVGMT